MRLLYITPYVEGVGGVPRVLSVKTNYLINKWNYDISILATNSGTIDTFYDFNEKIHFYSEKARGKNLVYIYYYSKIINKYITIFLFEWHYIIIQIVVIHKIFNLICH